jgi:RadC-like JAB domain
MNTTEDLITTGCPAVAQQPINQVIKPIKFPAQPQEWKIVSLRECPTPENMQQCETPNQAAAYWKTHIATHPYFNSECECLVVFILNTRRRIKGHYLVSIGTMDTILCHPREIFDWQLWQVRRQSSSRIIIRAVIRPHPRRTSKSPVTSFERANF